MGGLKNLRWKIELSVEVKVGHASGTQQKETHLLWRKKKKELIL